MNIKIMKWLPRPIKRGCRWLHREEGSITFEAALVMPLFIAFLFVFYAVITAISSQMALQHLASQSAQKLANYMHPAALVGDYVNEKLSSGEQADFGDAAEGLSELVYEIGSLLPHPLDVLLQEGSKGNYWPAANLAATVLGRDVLEGIIIGGEDYSVLVEENVKLVYLQLPDLVHYTDHNVIVALQYDLPFTLPFFGHRLSVREQAVQRVWLPDARPATFSIEEEEDAYIYITSLEPNPLKPGRKATIKATTLPNSSISLEVIYKSGSSVAKNLGTTTSNDKGEVEWTWHVSGNTTPGIWTLRLTLLEKDYKVEKPFQVKK